MVCTKNLFQFESNLYRFLVYGSALIDVHRNRVRVLCLFVLIKKMFERSTARRLASCHYRVI